MRKVAYDETHNARAKQADDDFDDFMQLEALTNDPATLAREIEAGAVSK